MHYSRFRVSDRLLLTGHSHQAWPDVAEQAHAEAWTDAADLVDAKWDRAEEKAAAVRAGYRRLLTGGPAGDPDGELSLGPSTHDLLVRLLSALDWDDRRVVVTTDGEFHSARRQLDRLEEEGIEIRRVPTQPLPTLAERLAAAVDDHTATVLVSKVLFLTGEIVDDLSPVATAVRHHGAAMIVDAYHALNVVDWVPADDDLADAFVLGGGYKYLQCGEGNCFLRWPRGTTLRPVVTGWYAEFGDLEQPTGEHRVVYGTGPERFAGSTYDPTSNYRAAGVFDFFAAHDLTPARLRQLSQHQVGRLRAGVRTLDLPAEVLAVPDTPLERLGGFLALRSPHAPTLRAALVERGLHCDHRGDVLRLGPAPYVTDRQLDEAVGLVGDAVRSVVA